jgi:hypothetical protein
MTSTRWRQESAPGSPITVGSVARRMTGAVGAATTAVPTSHRGPARLRPGSSPTGHRRRRGRATSPSSGRAIAARSTRSSARVTAASSGRKVLHTDARCEQPEGVSPPPPRREIARFGSNQRPMDNSIPAVHEYPLMAGSCPRAAPGQRRLYPRLLTLEPPDPKVRCGSAARLERRLGGHGSRVPYGNRVLADLRSGRSSRSASGHRPAKDRFVFESRLSLPRRSGGDVLKANLHCELSAIKRRWRMAAGGRPI